MSEALVLHCELRELIDEEKNIDAMQILIVELERLRGKERVENQPRSNVK